MPENHDRKTAIRGFRDRYRAAHPGESLSYQQASQWYDAHEAVTDWLTTAPTADIETLRAAVHPADFPTITTLADALLPVALHVTTKLRNRDSMIGRLPVGEGGMSKAWRSFALDLREALDLLVPDKMDPCLPGEEGACGHDYAHHCLSYMAALQAYAEYGLEHLHHGEADAERLADTLLDSWREQFHGRMSHEP